MVIDPNFPTKLDATSDAPEPLRSALVEILPPGEPVRLLLHAPAFSTAAVRSPATLLALQSEDSSRFARQEKSSRVLRRSPKS
jgi:hypothetical protein